MPLSQPDKDEIESLFVSLLHGDGPEQAQARDRLDALKRGSAAHRDYISWQEQINQQVGLHAATLRRRYPRVLGAPPVAARRGALAYRAPLALASGTALLLAAIVAWSIDPILSRRVDTTAIGQQTTVSLDDGSELLLNTDTSIRYLHRLRSREIILERGEALFKVAHDPWRPFSVDAGRTVVRDIGTTFSVRRRPTGADIAVLEGQVAVSLPEVSHVVRIVANQAIRTDGAEVKSADPAALTAWKARRVDFDGASLASVVAELGRYRRAPIVLADERAGQARISGGFSIDDIDQVLRNLPRVADVKVQFRADGSVVIASR